MIGKADWGFLVGYRFISDMERSVPRQGIDDFYIEIAGISVQPAGEPMGKHNPMIRLFEDIPNYIGKALDSTMKMMGRVVFRKPADCPVHLKLCIADYIGDSSDNLSLIHI